MKIVECKKGTWSYSLNFIDDNGVFLGYDYDQCCCESFGYITRRENKVISDSHEYDIEKLDGNLNLEGYNFDTNYIKEFSIGHETNCVEFKCKKKNCKSIYLILYNCHNGYYGYGFEFKLNDKIIKEGGL